MSAQKNASTRRTLVEFYDSEYMENIVSLLYDDYSDVVYIYFLHANEPTARDRNALSEFIKNNFGFTPKFLALEKHTIDYALQEFQRLSASGGYYDFDITGGSSVFIAAAGALAVKDGGERVSLHEHDPFTGKRTSSYPKDAPTMKRDQGQRLTVDHILSLRGIEMLHPDKPVRYSLSRGSLRDETLRLWNAIRMELRAWNVFSVLPTRSSAKRSGLFVDKRMSEQAHSTCSGLLKELSEHGIISELREKVNGNKINISYRLNVPEPARFLYNKGGNILEMLTYVTAVESGYFYDCCTGISLDWDSENRDAKIGPYNEIDTVLTHGHIPYFISCKNSDVKNEFLYEIMTMARHYGGKYAVPGLLCTARCNVHLHARAKEMGVILLDDIAVMNAREFSEKFTSALCT